jgi:hypothetical protein
LYCNAELNTDWLDQMVNAHCLQAKHDYHSSRESMVLML